MTMPPLPPDDQTPYLLNPDPQPQRHRRLWPIAIAAVLLVAIAAVLIVNSNRATPNPVAAATAPASTAATTTPVVDYDAACKNAVRTVADATGVISRFVKDPTLSGITDIELSGLTARFTAVGKTLPPPLVDDFDRLGQPIWDLLSVKTSGGDTTINTGVYPDTAPAFITACGTYMTGVVEPVAPEPVSATNSTTIDEGTWTVGEDVKAGTYKVVETADDSCYWARKRANGDIIDNYIGAGRPKVTIKKGETFETTGCPLFKKQR